MGIQVTDSYDIRERAAALGLAEPIGIVFLLCNFGEARKPEEFVYEMSLPDLRLLLREAGVEASRLGPVEAKPKLIKENAFDWTLPTLFIGGSIALLTDQIPN